MSLYTCPHCGEEVDTDPDPGADTTRNTSRTARSAADRIASSRPSSPTRTPTSSRRLRTRELGAAAVASGKARRALFQERRERFGSLARRKALPEGRRLARHRVGEVAPER